MNFETITAFGYFFAAFFVLGTLLFLFWAIKDNQFSNLARDSAVIFDRDEPLGVPCDRFPTKKFNAVKVNPDKGSSPTTPMTIPG